MKQFLVAAATAIQRALTLTERDRHGVTVAHDSPGGDAQFDVDLIAETAIWNFVKQSGRPLALYSEDGSLRNTSANPEHLLIADPIDGTRPAAAGLESCTVSLAAAPYSDNATIADVSHALLFELTTGRWIYTDTDRVDSYGYTRPIPSLTTTSDLAKMFWSIEFNGHPMQLMSDAYSHIVDQSANTGGVFVFNSASYSISRIVTGQLDAYVDIGNRLLRDHPETLPQFQLSGRGNVLHLFPYDIAAAVPIAAAAGAVVTDAYGTPFSDMLLTDISLENQRSCIAASNPELHDKLIEAIRW
jgi:myo-inositol-1(or 4)-monophosphatase